MSSQGAMLRNAMSETGMSQSGLSRLSGVHQSSISQFLSGKVGLSDVQLDRLLSSMGYRLEVERRIVKPKLTRRECRSWQLHREISGKLSRQSLEEWLPMISDNLDRLRQRVSGEPHERNLDRWEQILERKDVLALHRALTGLDRQSVEMREVSPMSGVLSESERVTIMGPAG